MRILIVSNYYPPYHEGGYEISIKETAEYLQKHGHEIYILTGIKSVVNSQTSIKEFSIDKPLRILRYIDYNNGSFLDKHRVEKFNYKITSQAIQIVQPDIIYIGNMKAVSISPVIAIQKSGVKYIYDIGDIWLYSYLGNTIKAKVFRWMKKILPFTIGGKIKPEPAIIISKWIMEELKLKFNVTDLYFVPRGILLHQYHKRQMIDPANFVYSGRIEPQKGLDLCIKALIKISRELPEFIFRFSIYGNADEDKAYSEYCRSLVQEAHLEKSIIFKGTYEDYETIFYKHDVLLMPTLAREAFGRVIIEAMACGCIVIASNAYGPAEIITDKTDGLLFNTGDIESLKELVISLQYIDKERLISISNQARNTVEKKYEISLVKKQIEEILVMLISK